LNPTLGLPEEAFRSAAVLGANYPDTYWYRQSLRLLQRYRDKHGDPVEGAVMAGPVSESSGGSGISATTYPGKSLPAPKGKEPKKPKSNPTKFPPRGSALPPPESE